MVTRRNGSWYVYFYPFKNEKIGIKLPDVTTKGEAKKVENSLLRACRSGDYSGMDAVSREACIRMFRNKSWELPPGLGAERHPLEELTLWRGIELCLRYPEIHGSLNRERHEQAFIHVLSYWGKEFPVKAIWIPHIKLYQAERLNQGAAASTINKERAALSKMFQVLIEMGLIDRNPVRMVKGPSDKDGRREVYLSFDHFNALVGNLPAWVKPIIQTLYFTGMRRGEALGLTWDNTSLESRIIRLHAHQTKERQPKRVPIHRLLVPILKQVGRVRSISTDRVFLTDRGKPPSPDSLKKPWKLAIESIGLNPAPTIHDLRHVWKTNAMRSGLDFEMREAILGHARGVAGRYGRISDDDLVRAVNGMRFNVGKTEIWVARREKENPRRAILGKNSNSIVTESMIPPSQEKGGNL
jgi:integrase